jgi:uncharacterized protein YbbC (DUF1343 family)
MPGVARPFSLPKFLILLLPLFGLGGCSASQPTRPIAAPTSPTPPPPTPTRPVFQTPIIGSVPAESPDRSGATVMLGIDVLEAEGFAALKGKRVALLTHPAGVNRKGVSTIDVLRRSPAVKLVALFAGEHGLYGDVPASVNVPNQVDKRTGLPVYSLHGVTRRPTKSMLQGIDAMVIDLQDIGTRSYTFVSAMKWTMEECFTHNVEVIVLDRPNPLGGLKVDGPPMDAIVAKANYVGAFRVPYVHGLTIGELARMAKEAPAVLEIPDAVRARGKLTVVPMRGWTRAMRWPETGLTFVPTSGQIKNWDAVQGYPMTGLGSYFGNPSTNFDIGFRTGVGPAYVFRGINGTRLGIKLEVLEKELAALQPQLPGVRFQRVSVPNAKGQPSPGVYVQIIDYDSWRPCDLNFWMMKLACKYSKENPFSSRGRDLSGFLRHLGSQGFLNDIAAKGAAVDVAGWLKLWREQARVYQEQSKKYWLYR